MQRIDFLSDPCHEYTLNFSHVTIHRMKYQYFSLSYIYTLAEILIIIKFITRINKIYSALCNLYACTCVLYTYHNIMVTTCCFKYIHRFVFAFVSCDYIGRFKQISNIFTQTQWIQVIYLSIFFRVASLALGQSYDCPSAIEVTLKNMGKINLYSTTTKHKVYP